MTVHHFEAGEERKFPLGPDLVEECLAVTSIESGSSEEWNPLFDPVAFNEAHGPLETKDYKLPPEDLE